MAAAHIIISDPECVCCSALKCSSGAKHLWQLVATRQGLFRHSPLSNDRRFGRKRTFKSSVSFQTRLIDSAARRRHWGAFLASSKGRLFLILQTKLELNWGRIPHFCNQFPLWRSLEVILQKTDLLQTNLIRSGSHSFFS